MFCRKKRLINFKAKVRKRLKQKNKELKARLGYAERLNKENNELVENNNKCVANMQATIDQKEKEIRDLKIEVENKKNINNAIFEQIEARDKRFDKLIECFNATEERVGSLKNELNTAKNRIKYEFNGK